MSSAFERLQKLAAEKQLKERAEKPRLEIVPVNADSKPNAPSALSSVSAPSAVSLILPTAPEKDFARVANSIVRQIPKGFFIGKSKQMYDYLYSMTRGAIKPTRSIRVSKSALMRGSGIRSTHTFYNNLRHLETIGLVVTTRIDGEKDGNSYEVFLPEEITDDLAHLEQLEHLTQLSQKLPVAVSAETALTALGSNPINIGTSAIPKTSFKDYNTNDDDYAYDPREEFGAYDAFIKKFQSAHEEITGKKLQKKDGENLAKIADLLILELKIAASRTETISSVPAFLFEILRRKFRDATSNAKSAKMKIDTVGKTEVASGYEIKPLDAEGKKEALQQLREFVNDDFLEDFGKWYTPDDWAWLKKQLAKESEKN